MERKINILIPVHLPRWWRDLAVERYAKRASPGTCVVGIDLAEEQQTRCNEDTLPGLLLENARIREREGAQAHIVDCFSNPGLFALSQELLSPVLGVGQAALLYGHGRFQRFGVITSEPDTVDRIVAYAASTALDAHLVGISSIDIAAADVPADSESAFAVCLKAARSFAQHAQAVVLGCTELAEFAPRLQGILATEGAARRVVNPIAVAVRFAEMYLRLEAEAASGEAFVDRGVDPTSNGP
jgi:Asp/Glu/hydantoin racemase